VPGTPAPSPAGAATRPPTPSEGILIVDKPAGWTSHDVVARMRRIAGTRRVGHAGTLDPMATGVLVVGVGRATRLLGHISGSDKTYLATIRLGWSTVTDDAEGDRVSGAPADQLGEDAVRSGITALTGPIMQRPSAVSAIKVEGRRAHDRVRAGEEVELAARPVVVAQFDLRDIRRDPNAGSMDLDVEVACSSGTYVRALARDLGAGLGVGGHLTALRRTRVGAFDGSGAHTLAELEQAEPLPVMAMAEAAHRAFPCVSVTDADANAVRHGRTIEIGLAWARAQAPTGARATLSSDQALEAAHSHTEHWPTPMAPPHALFAGDGEFLALAQPNVDGSAKYLAVFSQP
jgi:tRNA pseudouridine55 synthase